MTKNKDPMLQERGMMLKTQAITIGRPDVIPNLKRVLQYEYDDGYNSTCDAIEDAIVEIERLDNISRALHRENQYILAINDRYLKALSDLMPIQGMHKDGNK